MFGVLFVNANIHRVTKESKNSTKISLSALHNASIKVF